jgi:DHA1 family solute carrier family 18 vesicular amine transporter 1/2
MKIAIQRISLAPLLVIAFLSLVDTSFIAPIISSYAKSLGASDFEAGLVTGLYSAIAIPATIAMGYVIDRLGRRRVLAPLFVGDALSLYMYSLASNVQQLIIARSMHAIFDAGVFPASISMFREAIHGKRIGRYIGLYWLFISIAIILGSSTASLMVSRLGFKPIFQLLSILMLVGLISTIFTRELYRLPPERGRVSFSQLRGLWAPLIPAYLSAFILYMGIGAITGSLSPNLIKYMGFTERMGGVATGIYMAIATVTALPINILAGFLIERIGRYRVLFLGALFLALSMATLATSLAESARYVSSIFNGIALAMILVSSSEIAVNVPSPARGTSSAIYGSMLLIGVAIGSPLSGYLTEKVTISIRDLTLYSPYLVPAIMALILSASLAIYRPRSLEEKS